METLLQNQDDNYYRPHHCRRAMCLLGPSQYSWLQHKFDKSRSTASLSTLLHCTDLIPLPFKHQIPENLPLQHHHSAMPAKLDNLAVCGSTLRNVNKSLQVVFAVDYVSLLLFLVLFLPSALVVLLLPLLPMPPLLTAPICIRTDFWKAQAVRNMTHVSTVSNQHCISVPEVIGEASTSSLRLIHDRRHTHCFDNLVTTGHFFLDFISQTCSRGSCVFCV